MQSGARIAGGVRRERGYMLPLVILLVTVMIGTMAGLISISSTRYVKSTSDGDTLSAVYIAEAGISDTMAQLNNTTSFSGYPDASRKVFFNEPTKGRGEYATTVVDNGNKTVTITSIGYYYRNSTAPSTSAATQKRTIRVLALRTENPIQHNIVAGAGGIMVVGSNRNFNWYSSNRPGVTGSVYSRGKISLSGTAASIGNATTSVNVVAANEGCGSVTNWPQLCGNTSPPLLFDNGAKIYGTVCATGQSSVADILTGPTGTGLVSGCQAPVYKKVQLDKASFAATATNAMTSTNASCSTSSYQTSNKTVTYADKTVINGNVTIDSGTSAYFTGRCVVTVAGDVYIKGDLTLTGGARMVVADSVGTKKPRIVVNGKVRIAPQSSTAGVFANAQGTPLAIVGFWSTDNGASGCSQSNSCVELSTAHAYNSAYRDMTDTTSFVNFVFSDTNVAISIEGDEDGRLDGLMAYAYFGILRYNKPGTATIYGMGGESLYIKPCSSSNPFLCFVNTGGVSVSGDAPYSGVLYYDQYTILDYQQVY